ncbi:MAG: hypothetical protein IJV12_00365 [Acidaminococcaceae bacterium]|nr:hypothetical protein [Acidaminococcaceae bacterium]
MDNEEKYKILKKYKDRRFTAKDFPITDIDSKYLHQLTGSGDALAGFDQDDSFEISDEGKDFIHEYERKHHSITDNKIIIVLTLAGLIVSIYSCFKK